MQCAAISFAPNVSRIFSAGWRDALYHPFFKIGALPITLLFLVKAAIFFFLLMMAAKFVQRVLLTRVFHRLNISEGQRFALGRFTTYVLFFGGLFIGLQTLGLNLSSLLVFGGAVGVGVGLGLQNVVSNFVAGLILLIEQPIRMGDRVQTGNTMGDVVKIGARSTWIRTNDNFIIIVPNNEFINNPVTNWTANDPTVRVSLPVGVGYYSDPAKVRAMLLKAASEHADVLKDPAPDVIFTDYGDNSLNFTLRVWTSSKSHATAMLKSDLYFMLFDAFSTEKIELPFPQRDLHIRSFDVPVTMLRGNEEMPLH